MMQKSPIFSVQDEQGALQASVRVPIISPLPAVVPCGFLVNPTWIYPRYLKHSPGLI